MSIRSDVAVAIADEALHLFKDIIVDLDNASNKKMHKDAWTCWVIENIKWYCDEPGYLAHTLISHYSDLYEDYDPDEFFSCVCVTAQSFAGDTRGSYLEWGGDSPFSLGYSTSLYYKEI